MKYFILFALSLMLQVGYCRDELTPIISVSDDEEDPAFNPRGSHWLISFGTEIFDYSLPYEFEGSKRDFKPSDYTLYAAKIGLGREFYLGSGFLFGLRLDSYFAGNLHTDAKTAHPEYDIDVASVSDTNQMLGADAIAHLGWMTDFKTKNLFLGDTSSFALEFFTEAGFGGGRAYNKKVYEFDAAPATDEYFRMIVKDEFYRMILSAGITLTSVSSGYFFYLRGSYVSHDVTDREVTGKAKPDGGGVTSLDEDNLNPGAESVMMVGFGGGLKF